jgi:hypothetical protein
VEIGIKIKKDMGILSNNEQRKLAYFHALGKSMTENTQATYETKYKSSHNVRLNETWVNDINYCATYADAVNESYINSAITFYSMVTLDMIYGSNGQAYAYILNGTFKDDTYPLSERGQITSGGKFIKPFISPVDISDPITNEPSDGFTLRLFTENEIEIFQTDGAWTVDYYSGIIHFSNDGYNYTPPILGWGNIKASFFQYTGMFGNYTDVYFNSNTSQLIYNSGSTSEQIIDLSSLKSKISILNGNMVANNTTYFSNLACNTGILNQNTNGSCIRVIVNGVEVVLGVDCYFSGDNGVTARTLGTELIGDKLYWKYDINHNPVIGYNLISSDRISFVYLTN